METVLAELYEALGHLRYPEIAKIDLKDLSTTVLTGINRINLLAWLLSRASPTLSTHLEKFQGTSLKDEVVKCFLQMGISIDENTLLGNSSTKQQISTLKALLLFTKSLDCTDTVTIDDSAINEVLEKHINETINIIPPTCHVSMKLTESEAKKYLDEIKKNEQEVISVTTACEDSSDKNKVSVDNKSPIEIEQIASLDSMVEAFSEAFKSVESWKNTKSSDLPMTEANSLDETIQNLYKGLSSVSQVFESKEIISATEAPKLMEKVESPLSALIEDNVIFSEKIRSLYAQAQVDA